VRVLVVEDHAEVAELVGRALAKDGHDVVLARSITEAEARLDSEVFACLVVDIGLPDGDGLSFCAALRARGFAVPILVLTAQAQVSMRVRGLDAGADDYLPKPFAVAELRARVRALGRRAPETRAPGTRVGDAEVDLVGRRATIADVEVPLTAKEWEILAFLVARRGRLVPRGDLVDGVWNGAEGAEGSLEVLVARIRKKLGGSAVRTVRGEGYVID
jgi:two-component system OmpR family response regulator